MLRNNYFSLIVIILSILLIGCKQLNQPENESILQVDFDQQPSVSITTNTQTSIVWSTIDFFGGSFYYGLDKKVLINVKDFNASFELQKIRLSELIPNTKYYYTISFAVDDNIVPTDTLYFWTTNVPTTMLTDVETFQSRVISNLTGGDAIGDSVVLGARADSTERAIVANYLESEINLMGISAKRHNYSYHTYKGTNIYGTVPATVDTDCHIVIGAHYDSVKGCPGANDNASGVALVLSVMREILMFDIRTKHTIVVLFDQEESGPIGSQMFADSLYLSKIEIHSVHTIDQVAWDNDQDSAVELELPHPSLEFLYKASNAEFLNIPLYVTNTSSTDHRSFRALGFPSIGITEEFRNGDTTPYYHQSTDTYDTVNFDYLETTTNFIAYVIKLLLSQ